MAPHGDKSDATEEALVSEAEKRPISTILLVIGMFAPFWYFHSRYLIFPPLSAIIPILIV